MERCIPTLIIVLLLTSCSSPQETVDKHFERDYLNEYTPRLHGSVIAYEELGTLYTRRSVIVALRDDLCNRITIRGEFLHIDMETISCNLECRSFRVATMFERASLLPLHSIFRNFNYEQLSASPFITAELHVKHQSDTVSIPFWKIDAIVPLEP